MAELQLIEEQIAETDTLEGRVARRRMSPGYEDRIRTMSTQWDNMLPYLADALLSYQSQRQTLSDQTMTRSLVYQDRRVGRHKSVVNLLGMKEIMSQTLSHTSAGLSRMLLRHGYFPCSPVRPSTAFSITLLEFIINSASVDQSLSPVSILQSVYMMHGIGYPPPDAHAKLVTAILYYLEVQEHINRRIKAARRETDTALAQRLEVTCGACQFVGEKVFPVMLVVEGNSSFKRMKRIDDNDSYQRAFNCELKLDNTDVEEIRKTRGKQPKPKVKAGDNACVATTQDSSADKNKAGVYVETGVVVMMCRHGHLHHYCDVYKGDSSDYALALLDQATKTISPHIMMAYNAGCSFTQTVANSAMAEHVTSGRVKIMCDRVNVTGHNRQCQLEFNPRFIEGTGIEDYQQTEQLFSSTKMLAPSTRRSTSYYRHQKLNLAFRFNNETADMELGTLLMRKYENAVHTKAKAEKLLKETGRFDEDKRKELLKLPGEELALLKQRPDYLAPRASAENKLEQLLMVYAGRQIDHEKAKAKLDAFDKKHKGREFHRMPVEHPLSVARSNLMKKLELLDADLEFDAMLVTELMPSLEFPRDKDCVKVYEAKCKVYASRREEAINKLHTGLSKYSSYLSRLNQAKETLPNGKGQLRRIIKRLFDTGEEISEAALEFNKIAGDTGDASINMAWADIEPALEEGDMELVYSIMGLNVATSMPKKETRIAVNAALRYERANEELERLRFEVHRVLHVLRAKCDLLHRNAERLSQSDQQSDVLLAVQERINYTSFVNLHKATFDELRKLHAIFKLSDSPQDPLLGFSWPSSFGQDGSSLPPNTIMRLGQTNHLNDIFPPPAVSDLAVMDIERHLESFMDVNCDGGESSDDEDFFDYVAAGSTDQVDNLDILAAVFDEIRPNDGNGEVRSCHYS